MAFRAPSSTFQPELVWFRLPRFPSHFWIAKYTLYQWNVAAADVGWRLCSKNVVDLPIICMYMTWRSWSGASDIHVGLHSLRSNFSSTWAISSWPDLLSGRHPVHLSPPPLQYTEYFLFPYNENVVSHQAIDGQSECGGESVDESLVGCSIYCTTN